MSVEEENELKNLVAQTLENKGILPKIRAELRANVFLALEENQTTRETVLKNEELSALVKIPVGTLILNLIREFLEFFELDFTLSVFDPETKYGKEYNNITRDKMMKDLKIIETKKKGPVLCELIERIINSNGLRVWNSDKSSGDFNQSDISASGDCGNIPHLTSLNSTYIKATSDIELIPLSPVEKEESKCDDNEASIKEELISNISEAELDVSSKTKENEVELSSKSSSEAFKVNSPKTVPKDPIEIDLLTFTPVKGTKLKEKPNNATQTSGSTIKTDDKKEAQKSVLGDLPPLTPKAEEKGDKINEIKAMIEGWPDLENEDEFSVGSKSSKDQVLEDKLSLEQLKSDRSENLQNLSQKSDKTETEEDFEEDISDLVNGHTPLDSQITIDETLSKVSGAADYLESL